MACIDLDQDGKSKPMIMGCYGIGVGRAMAPHRTMPDD